MLYIKFRKNYATFLGENQVIKVVLTSAKTESNYPDDFDTRQTY